MSVDARSPIVIVGAGVAGLTLAHQLAPHRRVSLIETLNVVGGLARSWHYGDFHFDVGPHRFHTEQPRVADFIKQILGADAIEIRRKSGARMFGRFHEWPLRPSVLWSMPWTVMLRAGRDLVRREHMQGHSFEADIVNKYGRTLHDIFFDPYTRKFLFHAPSELHRDWGRAGVNRAVIDQRAAAETLWGLIRTTLLPKPVETTFLYAPDGVGRFSARLAERIVSHHGSLQTGRAVTALEVSQDHITAVWTGDTRIACESLIWTGPLSAINPLLGIDGVPLRYLSTIFFNLELSRPVPHEYQWIYYGGDEVFSRVSSPTAFAPTMAPQGKGSLCVEVTCIAGDDRWNAPERLIPSVIADLVRTGTIHAPGDVGRVHVEPVRDTYPIYTLDYLEQLTANLRRLARFKNLLLAGRSGRFWYNNMDHSIGQGLTMADKILAGTMLNTIGDDGEREFWKAAT